MYKNILIIFSILFLGCANKINVDKNIKETNIENYLIQKYQITKKALTKLNNNYYFYTPDNNGLSIYKLNKNYEITNKKTIPLLIDAQKLISDNKNLYLIGYEEKKQKPILIVLDKNLNIKLQKFIGNRFDIPKDIITKPKIAILLLTYKNGADIKICNLKKCKTYIKPSNQFPKFIKRYNNGYLVGGSIQDTQEDLYVAFIKNNKIIWQKRYDFGFSDNPTSITIKNNQIIIDVVSTDYMGADKYLKIILDENGKLIKKIKKIELKPLPTKFRT